MGVHQKLSVVSESNLSQAGSGSIKNGKTADFLVVQSRGPLILSLGFHLSLISPQFPVMRKTFSQQFSPFWRAF